MEWILAALLHTHILHPSLVSEPNTLYNKSLLDMINGSGQYSNITVHFGQQ